MTSCVFECICVCGYCDTIELRREADNNKYSLLRNKAYTPIGALLSLDFLDSHKRLNIAFPRFTTAIYTHLFYT